MAKWVVAKLPGSNGSTTVAVPVLQHSLVRLIAAGGISLNDIEVRWSGDGRSIYFRLQATEEPGATGRTYTVPLRHGQVWPDIPERGIRSEAELAKLPGASLLNAFDAPGPTPQIYAFVRMTVQRNLFRVPVP